MPHRVRWLALLLPLALSSCFTNNPYAPQEAGRNIYYDTFSQEPKYLDPARSYYSYEYSFITQIYEPVVQYHYLKRPYRLIPLTAERVPEPKMYDPRGRLLPADAPAKQVARVVYEIKLKPGIAYQDHPCFARAGGRYVYHLGPDGHFPKIEHPCDLPQKGTRTLRAEDYVYQIKRLANPLLQCPIFPVLAKYIDGFSEFSKRLSREIARIRAERRQAGGAFYNQEEDEKRNPILLDLRAFKLRGAQTVDALTYRIVLKKKYPQFRFWLAMPFFSPVPWEAERFYRQAAASEQNLTLNRFPVGTGPYTLAVYRPNYRITLRRNPNFHEDHYPSEGEADDRAEGRLDDAGKRLPFIEEAVYVLEKESVPAWNKFLQGYYDTSGIGSDMFDQAIKMSTERAGLSDFLKAKHVRLQTAVSPTTYYYAFNMLDDVVGGYGEKKQKLRQALSIAFNMEEYIQIFANGRGEPAQGPIPPGIAGYQKGRAGLNPYVYEWDEPRGARRRKSLAQAKRLLAEAGYPGGRDKDGKPLVLFYDSSSGGGAGVKAFFDWMRKQFGKLGIELQIRVTDLTQFRDKIRKGNYQIIGQGWHADYPDPENFFFLLHGPQGKVKAGGENSANYDNPRFNKLFEQMENMNDSPERERIIREMLKIIRADAPWIWGWHLVGYGLYHEWYRNAKPMSIGGNTLKYKRIDTALREERRREWNRPVTWPLWAFLALLAAGTLPACVTIYKRERGVAKR